MIYAKSFVMQYGNPALDQRERKWGELVEERDRWKAKAEQHKKTLRLATRRVMFWRNNSNAYEAHAIAGAARIAELEAENTALRATIADLETGASRVGEREAMRRALQYELSCHSNELCPDDDPTCICNRAVSAAFQASKETKP